MALTKATLIDLNSNELILDLDADTSITADTDDTIHFKIAGADEIVMTGTALTPAVADGSSLGSTALEWSDLFLADGGTIQFGNDQEVILTHVADVGLKLSHEATGDNLPIVLNLESEEDDIVSGEEIGRIDFTAGDSGGTDAILTAASIAATTLSGVTLTDAGTLVFVVIVPAPRPDISLFPPVDSLDKSAVSSNNGIIFPILIY